MLAARPETVAAFIDAMAKQCAPATVRRSAGDRETPAENRAVFASRMPSTLRPC